MRRKWAHSGPAPDLGPIEYRSSWERNIQRLLNHLNIGSRFEPRRFKLAPHLSYLPDFELDEPNPWNCKWLEIKGRWNFLDQRKLTLFMQLFPQEKLHTIASNEYRQLAKQYKDIISHWEK